MTTRPDVDRQVASLARVDDADLAYLDHSAAARQLLAALPQDHPAAHVDSLTGLAPRRQRWPLRSRWDTVPRPRRRTVRIAAGAVAVGAIAAVLVVGPEMFGGGTAESYANSAIAIHTEGRFFVARIKNPLADHSLYTQGFRAVGLDVDFRLVPVAPASVGRVVGGSSGGTGNSHTSGMSTACEGPADACVLTVRISTDTTGHNVFFVGRAARSGEPLWTSDSMIPKPPAGTTCQPTAHGGQVCTLPDAGSAGGGSSGGQAGSADGGSSGGQTRR